MDTVLEHEVKDFIVGEFAPDLSPGDLDPGYDLLDNGVLRSLDLLRLVAWVGDRYDIAMAGLPITPQDFSSVESISTFIQDHRTN